MNEKLVIIGSGPAAHTAAIYSGRAELSPLLFEGFMAGGVAAGGQLTTTNDVENFPGFPEGISGPLLMDKMREQSLRYGCRIVTKTISGIHINEKPFEPFVLNTADNEEYLADTIIIATGATAKTIELPNSATYWQKGISSCAVCDGALPIFRGKDLFVVGGGDSACEEALFLTKFAKMVYLVHRRNELRASKIMQRRVLGHDKIEVLWEHEITNVLGDEKVIKKVVLKKSEPSQVYEKAAGGLFFAIGHKPNTDFLGGKITLDKDGYIVTEKGSTKTNVLGIFAAGDVQDKKFRQAVTAAGTGCMAFMEAEEYLNTKDSK